MSDPNLAYVSLLSRPCVAKKKTNLELAGVVLTQAPDFFEAKPLAALSFGPIIGLLIDDYVNILAHIHSPSFLVLAGSTGLSKVSSVKSCWNLVLSVKTFARSLPAPWPTVSGWPDVGVQPPLEAMSLETELLVDGGGGGMRASSTFCSEEHLHLPHFYPVGGLGRGELMNLP